MFARTFARDRVKATETGGEDEIAYHTAPPD
jgi:hypothetical protein